MRPYADLAQPRHRPGPDRGQPRMILTPKIFARLVVDRACSACSCSSPSSPRSRSSTSAPTCCRRWSSALGLLGGSMTGAVSGFSIGFLSTACWSSRSAAPRWSCSRSATWPGSSASASRSTARLVAAAALRGADPVRRARLRRRPGDARHRRAGQPAGRPRHAAEEPSSPSSSAGRSTSACAASLRPALVEEATVRAAPAADGAGSVGSVYLRSERARPATANRPMALRIAVVGGVALALFAILFFRLWILQVLDGSQYLAEAKNNRTREFKVIAPRGEILDRNGERPGRQPDQPGAAGQPAKLPEDPRRRTRRADPARRTRPHVAEAGARDDRTKQEEVARRRAGHPAPRRRLRPRLLPRRKQGPLPGRRRSSGSSSAATRTEAAPPTSLGNVGEVDRRRAQGTALQGPRTGRRGRPGRASSTPTTNTCAASRG